MDMDAWDTLALELHVLSQPQTDGGEHVVAHTEIKSHVNRNATNASPERSYWQWSRSPSILRPFTWQAFHSQYQLWLFKDPEGQLTQWLERLLE